jgi:hypothetical protein
MGRLGQLLFAVAAVGVVLLAWLVGGLGIWIQLSDPPQSVRTAPNGLLIREHLAAFFITVGFVISGTALVLCMLARGIGIARKAMTYSAGAALAFIIVVGFFV